MGRVSGIEDRDGLGFKTPGQIKSFIEGAVRKGSVSGELEVLGLEPLRYFGAPAF